MTTTKTRPTVSTMRIASEYTTAPAVMEFELSPQQRMIRTSIEQSLRNGGVEPKELLGLARIARDTGLTPLNMGPIKDTVVGSVTELWIKSKSRDQNYASTVYEAGKALGMNDVEFAGIEEVIRIGARPAKKISASPLEP